MFHQTLVHDGPTGVPTPERVLVTYLPAAGVPRPVMVDGRAVLEHDSPAVWFTFPGARHDIGRFHTPQGELTGLYANILTPVEIVLGAAADGAEVWRTTDLFLDLFVTPGGAVHTLDRDELEAAVRQGHVSPDDARVARDEARRLARLAQDSRWPPPVVEEWTLERARAVCIDRQEE